MNLPKFYLIKSDLTEAEWLSVRNALQMTPVSGIFAFKDADANHAKSLFEAPVVRNESPMAIIGAFDTPLAVIDADGSYYKLEL